MALLLLANERERNEWRNSWEFATFTWKQLPRITTAQIF
jgi:hypothetical protein